MRTQWKNCGKSVPLCCVLLYDLWLAAQIPYTHDDWDWGLEIGLTHLLRADINSRYAGNLIEVLLTRSPLLKTVLMGAVLFLLPCLMAELALRSLRRGRPAQTGSPAWLLLFLLADALLFLTPVSVWRQTCGWVAGFSNFVVSGLMLLLFLLLVMRLEETPDVKLSAGRKGLLVAFGITIQLFLENLSVFFFLATLFLVIRRRLRKQRVGSALLCLLLGTALGLAVVFSSSIYQSLWETGDAVDGYRHLMVDRKAPLAVICRDLYERTCYVVFPKAIELSGPLPAAILCAMLLVCLDGARTDGKRRAWLLLLAAAHAVLAGYFLCRWLSERLGLQPELLSRLDLRLDGVQFLFYLLLILLDLCLFFRRDPRRFSLLLSVWVSPILILLPMAVVNTFGARSCFTSNLCWALFLLMLTAPVAATATGLPRRALAVGLTLCLLVCLVRFGRVYAQIGTTNRQRLAVIRTARDGAVDTIELPAYPYPTYLWFPDPIEERVGDFKAFYGIPAQVTVLFPAAEA